MSEAIVRRATLADLDLVTPLFDAYRQYYACSPGIAACRAFLSERIERDESVVFVATLAGRGVGFTQLYPRFTSIGLNRAWILNDLYVDSSARRTGVGRLLMNAAKQFAVANGSAWLELATAKDNHGARAFYRGLGYKLDEKFEHFKLTLR
ncbi:MAG: GNAT family N-acetyltransferase [Gemmataceae bacterium]|nr:GNAT family N-acetyltransferase [Gemmataceae bacterium]